MNSFKLVRCDNEDSLSHMHEIENMKTNKIFRENTMRFGYTIIYVSDVESTINFYKNAFNFELNFLHESKQYGELNTGDTKIAFASNEMAQSNGVKFVANNLKNDAAGFEIALITSDVKYAYKHATDNGAIAVTEPILKPWGQEVAYVRDPNGIIIEICSPMS